MNRVTKFGGVTLAVDDSREALGHIHEGRASVALVLDQRVLPCNATQQEATHVATCEPIQWGLGRVVGDRLFCPPPDKTRTANAIRVGRWGGRHDMRSEANYRTWLSTHSLADHKSNKQSRMP